MAVGSHQHGRGSIAECALITVLHLVASLFQWPFVSCSFVSSISSPKHWSHMVELSSPICTQFICTSTPCPSWTKITSRKDTSDSLNCLLIIANRISNGILLNIGMRCPMVSNGSKVRQKGTNTHRIFDFSGGLHPYRLHQLSFDICANMNSEKNGGAVSQGYTSCQNWS